MLKIKTIRLVQDLGHHKVIKLCGSFTTLVFVVWYSDGTVGVVLMGLLGLVASSFGESAVSALVGA